MFSLFSWNVENFKGGQRRVRRVAEHILEDHPDVFGLFEVEGVNIMGLMQDQFPAYDLFITDGPQNKEILVGCRRQAFDQVVFTQKREFKAHNPFLRPGALLTLAQSGRLDNILFLHTDSGTEAADFGNRYEMFERIWRLKKAIDNLAGGRGGRLVAFGDFNTMGLLFPSRRSSDQRVSQDDEIAALDQHARRMDMTVLPKQFAATFNNERLVSDLDHVMASDNLQVRPLGTRPDGEPFQVKVVGWQQLAGTARTNFIRNISDHCSLYLEIDT